MRASIFLLAVLQGIARGEGLLGGWSRIAPTPDTRATLLQALSSTDTCVRSIVSVRAQVVAGMNYDFEIDGCRHVRGGSCRGFCSTPGRFVIRVFDQPWTRTTSVVSISPA